jgi:glycosyltransferase involved in cell wall biosynthesis
VRLASALNFGNGSSRHAPKVNRESDSPTVAALPRGKPHDAEEAPKTRVLIVSPQPFYQDRGTPIAVSQLAAALSALDYEVDLLAYPIGTPVHFPGLRIVRGRNPFGIRDVKVGFSFKKIVLDIGMLGLLVSMIRSRDYGAVHVLEEMAWPAVVFCRRLNIPVIYDMQSSLPEQLRTHGFFRLGWVQRVLHALEVWVLRRSNAVVCAAGLLNHVKALAPGVTAYEWKWPGLEPDALKRSGDRRAAIGIGADRKVILYAGTFEPYQGIDAFLEALAAVTSAMPSAVGVLIGATPHNDLGSDLLASRLAFEGKLHVLPRQPRHVVPSYLAMADVLVSPRAYGDNVPLKIFDYVLSGKPIVATDIRAHRSILDDRSALLVPRTAEGLSAGIQRLLRDTAFGAGLAATALTRASAAPGKEAYMNLVESIFASTVEPSKLAPRARRVGIR